MELRNGSYENLEFDEGCYINISLSNNEQTFPLHWHTAAEIIMPLEGTYSVNVNGNAYPLKTNDILFVSIGELHEMTKPSYGYRMILQFDFSLINNLKDFKSSISILQSIKLITKDSDPDIHSKIVELMVDIRNEYATKSAFNNAVMYSKLLQIYVLIARKYINMSNLFPDITLSKQQEYIVKFSQLFSYINSNFTEDITLEILANHAGFSKFHFSRLFKQFTNMTLYDYINQKRISEAELLLLNPNLSITEVSSQSGFNSLSTFNRVFKTFKNCTPTEFKNLYNSH